MTERSNGEPPAAALVLGSSSEVRSLSLETVSRVTVFAAGRARLGQNQCGHGTFGRFNQDVADK